MIEREENHWKEKISIEIQNESTFKGREIKIERVYRGVNEPSRAEL